MRRATVFLPLRLMSLRTQVRQLLWNWVEIWWLIPSVTAAQISTLWHPGQGLSLLWLACRANSDVRALTSLYSDISMPKYGLKLRHGNDISMALTSLYSDISMPKYGIRLRHGNDIRMPKYGVKLRHDISMLKYMELSSDMAMTSACSMPKYGVYMGVFASRAPVRGAASYWLLITYPYLLLLLLHLFHHYLQHIYCPQRKYIY